MSAAGAQRLTAANDAAVIVCSYDEPGCFALVFDRHAPVIHRYLSRRVGTHAADDLVAETFLTAFAKRRRYDARHSDARPWLYGIATNLVARRRRDETRLRTLGYTAGLDPTSPDHAHRVAADVTAQSIRSVLFDAVGQLSARDRDVVLLIACEELSYEEVSRALGIPVGTVRSRLNRARTQLRKALDAIGETTTYEEILTGE